MCPDPLQCFFMYSFSNTEHLRCDCWPELHGDLWLSRLPGEPIEASLYCCTSWHSLPGGQRAGGPPRTTLSPTCALPFSCSSHVPPAKRAPASPGISCIYQLLWDLVKCKSLGSLGQLEMRFLYAFSSKFSENSWIKSYLYVIKTGTAQWEPLAMGSPGPASS